MPGPVYVEVPANLYIFTHEVDLDAQREAGAPRSASPSASGSASASASTTPPPPDLDRAAGILQTAKRPLLYLGLGALGAADRLVALAERLEAPVATTFQGKGVFPETHPLFLWPGFGAAAPRFARKAAADCDAVLAIGCRFGEVGTGSYGIELPGPLVHVDIDPAVLGRNFPAEVALNADARVVVRELLERLKPVPADHALRQRIADGHREVEVAWSKSRSADRVTPHTLLRAIHGRFGADTVFTTDSGNGTFLAMEILRLEGPRRFLAPVDYSCMGYSVPAAVGAKLAAPDRPVVALAGDGAFLMTGLEALTAASHAVPVAIFVLRDRELAQIAQFQETALNRKTASAVHDYDAVALARSMGVEALRLERDDQIPEALERVAEITGAASPGEASPGMSNGVAGSESAASATGGSAPAAPKAAGRPVLVDVAIDYSAKTYFTRGVVKTNLQRLPWKDRVRFVGRAVGRRFFG